MRYVPRGGNLCVARVAREFPPKGNHFVLLKVRWKWDTWKYRAARGASGRTEIFLYARLYFPPADPAVFIFN